VTRAALDLPCPDRTASGEGAIAKEGAIVTRTVVARRPSSIPGRLVAAALAVVATSLGSLAGCGGGAPSAPPPVAPPPPGATTGLPDHADLLARGLPLYQKQCATCHGDQGYGDGPAAYLLNPKPRDFASGVFRLTSSSKGLPSDDDLRATLKRGMPGSAMPPWDHLPAVDLDALVVAIRHLAVEGRVARLRAQDADLSAAEAREIATGLMAPGPAVPLPPPVPSSAALVARGRDLYAKNCASCHDTDGRGRLATDMKDAQGNPIFARDFTQGIFKGGGDAATIVLRILRGLPGSPMPENPLPAEDAWAIAHHVRTMVPEGVEERVRLNQRELTATRVAGPLASAPDAAVWNGVPATTLALTQLWWRTERIAEVAVQALHDGERIAVRLRWADATRDDLVNSQHAFTDGAALQLSADPDPPLFAMGASGAPCTIWHWKAAWSRDIAEGQPTMPDRFPNMVEDLQAEHSGNRADLYLTGRAAGNPLAQADRRQPAEECSASGFGTLATRPPTLQRVEAGAQWADGEWTVVLMREARSGTASDCGFTPGGTVSVAFALFDGAARDRNGQKAISIWHRLRLAK
jgi:DMSO reductase family type II enzyme heme b subunit